MKLKKNYAIGLSIIFGLIVLLLCCFTLKTLINNNKSNDAKRYIANKYNIETDLISEVSYTKKHLEPDFVLFENFNIWVVPSRWKFNYGEREFNVEYINDHFVDDYQLEDLEIWCTEYLQDNVDSNISGIELYSDMIFHDNTYDMFSKRSRYYTVRSSKSLSYSDNKLWKQEDISEFLNYQFDNYKHLGVFYKTDNISKYSTTDINSSYDNLVQTLNHNATISNCTLTPILYSGTLELVRNKDCLYLLYNKNGTAITVDDTDLNYVVYNFTIYKRNCYEIKLGKCS